MSDLTFKSTQVKFSKPRDECIDLEFLGLVSSGTFDVLVPKLVEATHTAKALFVRMDRATTLMCFDKKQPSPAFSEYTSPPGCIIVRRDQWQACSEYARMLAQHNVRRLVFLREQIEIARNWVERQKDFPVAQSYPPEFS